MKRISILTSAIICVALFVACTNSVTPSLECKARAFVDSLVTKAKDNPNKANVDFTKTLEYINTTFSDEELCVMNYSAIYNSKKHSYEFIVIHSPKDDKYYAIIHITDSCVSSDHFKGLPVANVFNLESKELRKQLLNAEGRIEWPLR